MRPFAYQKADASAPAQAFAVVSTDNVQLDSPAQFLAGGTTLVDLMKLDVMRPSILVDINPLAEQWSAIEIDGENLRLGALARMSDVTAHPEIRRGYPVISASLELAASPQLRNMAMLGGNVLQRTRCSYFRDTSYGQCNKRAPGTGCAAMDGFNRNHAVLGTSDQCIASYPGDFAQALIALDAAVEIVGRSGPRTIAFADLHKAPGNTPQIETTLAPGDLITAFQIRGRWPRSVYLKARDRQSFEFALASAAVALDVEDGVIRDARVALGGVATVPWRSREAEALLKGQKFDDGLAQQAAEAAFEGAAGSKHNSFKIPLGKRLVGRALRQAALMEV
jgi:xanthine dehydrogenase YagS FAD-binding subunit